MVRLYTLCRSAAPFYLKPALNNGFKYRERIDNRGNGLSVPAYLTLKHRHSSWADWQGCLAPAGFTRLH
jgi:hypothetical protein